MVTKRILDCVSLLLVVTGQLRVAIWLHEEIRVDRSGLRRRGVAAKDETAWARLPGDLPAECCLIERSAAR